MNSGLYSLELLEKVENSPTSPGVYLMKDERGHVLYVGKAKNLKARVKSYFQSSAQLSPKTQHLVAHIRDIEFLRAASEVEALLLENNLIKKWKPKYNISLKDDKTYPYIKLDLKHEYPRATVARRQSAGDGAEYFGPYPQGGAVRDMIEWSSKIFRLRDCRDHEFANRSRPCLSHQIGHCTAPCVGLVSAEEYSKQVAEFRAFLKGESDALETEWEREMTQASEKLEYEKAAEMRDRLAALRAIVYQNQRIVDTQDLADRDVWAFWPLDLEDPSPALDILVLQIRQGKWVGRAHRTALLEERLGTEDFWATLVLEYYRRSELPPASQILLPNIPFPSPPDFAESLRLLKELPEDQLPEIHFYSERESWARLGDLAMENVKGLHEDHEKRRQRSQDGLEALARLAGLPAPPRYMEAMDISNLQGEANVASCVVFREGVPDRSSYRHYKIAGFSGQNDFASMQEVLRRRYGKPDSPRPDLLVVDGGKGQLAVAVEVLNSLNLEFPVVGLAKARVKRDFRSSKVESSQERLFFPGQKNAVPVKHAAALQILTHLRDEAHRFAIEFHRQQRSRARGL